MNNVVPISLPFLSTLVERAATALSAARSAAEVLDAKEAASMAYDAARMLARFAAAKDAHDALVEAAHRAQADALEIEVNAKCRIADEYDAAQNIGEVALHGGDRRNKVPEWTLDRLGFTGKGIFEARFVRDAERSDPGIVRRTLDARLNEGAEPTKAALNKALRAARPPRSPRPSKRKRARGKRQSGPTESQHDRDLRMLLGVWDVSCQSARDAFLEQIST